jgi:hypothetical protein
MNEEIDSLTEQTKEGKPNIYMLTSTSFTETKMMCTYLYIPMYVAIFMEILQASQRFPQNKGYEAFFVEPFRVRRFHQVVAGTTSHVGHHDPQGFVDGERAVRTEEIRMVGHDHGLDFL